MTNTTASVRTIMGTMCESPSISIFLLQTARLRTSLLNHSLVLLRPEHVWRLNLKYPPFTVIRVTAAPIELRTGKTVNPGPLPLSY